MFVFLDPGYRIVDPGSRILDPGCCLQAPGSRVLEPGSWIQDVGYRILAQEHVCVRVRMVFVSTVGEHLFMSIARASANSITNLYALTQPEHIELASSIIQNTVSYYIYTRVYRPEHGLNHFLCISSIHLLRSSLFLLELSGWCVISWQCCIRTPNRSSAQLV